MENLSEKPSEHEARHEKRHERHDDWREYHQTEYWESRIFGAFTMIIIGIIFLLNTTGVLPWSVWINIFKFWPLFIVSAGIGIIFNGSRVAKLIGNIITFIIFVVIMGLAVFTPFSLNFGMFTPVSNNTADSQSSSYFIGEKDYKTVKSRVLAIDLPIGDLTLNSEGTENYLSVKSQFYGDYQKPEITKTFEDDVLNVNFTTNKTSAWDFSMQGPKYDFVVGQATVPTTIQLKVGAGNAKVSLDDFNTTDITGEVGAGNLELTLTKTAMPNGDFNFKTGVGNLTMNLPKSVGLKINYKVGLGSIKINDDKITNGTESSTYMTDNYSSATIKTVLNLEVGLGNINIVTE